MKAFKVTIIILAVIGALVGGYVALVIYINIPSDIILAKNANVTPEWTEIDVKPAVRAEHRYQSISLTIANIAWEAKLDGMIHLEDGTMLRPELELIDENGSVQPLTLSGFTRKYGVAANYRATEGTLGFAKDRKFVKLRIKSDIPFASKIAWKDYDPK